MSDLTPREPVAPMSVREFARKTGLCTATAHRVLAGEELSLSNARAAHPFLKKCPCCGQAALDAVRAEVAKAAFMDGATAVHEEWHRAHEAGEGPPRCADFDEAANDYAVALMESNNG